MSELCAHGKPMFSPECTACATETGATFKVGDTVEGHFVGLVVSDPEGTKLHIRLVNMAITTVNGRSLLKKDGGL